MMKLKNHLSFVLILSLLFSCGKSAEEAIEDAILTANQYLSKGNCQPAIDLLEGLGRQNTNKEYLITLASAYGCRGNYNELTMFTSDITKVGTPSTLGGFITFTSSTDMTSPTDSDFLDVNTALDILLYAGGIASTANPTSAIRKAVFGASASGDIDAMIMYITMVQLGRWLRYYGTPDTSGNKNAACILNYNGALMQDTPANDLDTILGALPTGPCTSSAIPGSADIGNPGSYNITRACQGVYLLNNFLDVMPNVLDNYTGGELSSVTAIRTLVEAQATALRVAKNGTEPILAVTNLSRCISENNLDDTFLQWWYVYMMEPLYL